MRIATWNVNSLKARQEAVESWLERAAARRPAHAGDEARRRRRAGHGVRDGRLRAGPPRRGPLERRRDRRPPGHRRSATSSRTSATARSATADPVRPSAASEEDFDPFDEARMVSAVVDRVAGGRSGSSASTPRTAGSSARRSTTASCAGTSGSRAGSARTRSTATSRWSSAATSTSPRPTPTSGIAAAVHGGTHVSEPERAGVPGAPRLGPRRRLPARHDGARPLHVVGLPGRQVPQELRDADRPPARRPGRSPTAWSGPRSTARRARARRSRRTTRRSSSTSTSPAGRSTPAGPARSGPDRGADRDRRSRARSSMHRRHRLRLTGHVPRPAKGVP